MMRCSRSIRMSLGKQATTVTKDENTRVYAKNLEDGSIAVGLFNVGVEPVKVMANFRI